METRKRRKKKSFLQRAKQFGKQGRFGKGKSIDQSTYDYFIGVLVTLQKDDFENEDDRDICVQNVFKSTIGLEFSLCSNQLVSRVIEQFLPLADHETQSRFMTELSKDLRIICLDPYASHILEKLLFLCSFSSKKDVPIAAASQEWVLRICKFAINNIDDFVFDAYASHILRSTFQCLSGIVLPEEVVRSRKSRSQNAKKENQEVHWKFSSNDAFSNALLDAVFQIKQWKDDELLEVLSDDVACGVAQSLIMVLEKCDFQHWVKFCERFADVLIKSALSDDSFFEYQPIIRILETLLTVTTQEISNIWNMLYKGIFENNLVKIALHSTGNFALQKLLNTCRNKEQFESWYERELDSKIESIFQSGHTGVILSIAKACRRLDTKQGHFVVSIMKCLHCFENQSNLVTRLAHMILFTQPKIGDDSNSYSPDDTHSVVHLQGSLILQELLCFKKPIKIVISLLSMAPPKLRQLLCDPRGSHITDAFMNSSSIGEKSRESLVKSSLKGQLVGLACSKHGSRSIESIWKRSSMKTREHIASELCVEIARLKADNFGKFIASNFALDLFKRSRSDWRTDIDRHEKDRIQLIKMATEFSDRKRTLDAVEKVKKEYKEKKEKRKKPSSYFDDL